MSNRKVINPRGEYPYNVIPIGYPESSSTEELKEVIHDLLRHMISHADEDSELHRDYALINIGQNEINDRESKRMAKIAISISVTTAIISIFVLTVSVLTAIDIIRWRDDQITELRYIQGLMIDQYNSIE